jgi:hypothetical protein
VSRLDPLSWSERYPHTPGFKARDTSKDAAEAVGSRAVALRSAVLTQITASAATADEVANRLGESVLAIRPRVSELSRMGQITDSGLRRPNASGKSAIVWTVSR